MLLDERSYIKYYGDAHSKLYLKYAEIQKKTQSPDFLRGQDLLGFFKKNAGIGNSDYVLDIGAFNGENLGSLVKSGCVGVGIDLGLPTLLAASRQFSCLSFLQADGLRLPFRDESFDVVTCCEVIEHVYRPKMLVSEIARVLKSGGRVVLSTPNIYGLATLFPIIIYRVFNLLGRERVIKLLKAELSPEIQSGYLKIWEEAELLARDYPGLKEHRQTFSPAELKRLLNNNGLKIQLLRRKGFPSIFPGRLADRSPKFNRIQKFFRSVFGSLPLFGVNFILVAKRLERKTRDPI